MDWPLSLNATSPDPAGFEAAVSLLRAGELVAFPTDTVYGVGAVFWDSAAVGKLYVAKLRSLDKAIPLLLADPQDLSLVAGPLSSSALRLARHFWPGALTLVVTRGERVPYDVTAGGETVAVRIPDLPLARALIRAVGAPLATTSANLSGREPALNAQEAADQLGGRIAMILDGGACPGGIASTVVDVTSPEPRVLRAGPITEEQLRRVL